MVSDSILKTLLYIFCKPGILKVGSVTHSKGIREINLVRRDFSDALNADGIQSNYNWLYNAECHEIKSKFR